MKTRALFLLSLSVAGLLNAEVAAQKPVATKSDATQINKVTSATDGNLDAQIADTLYRLTRARLERAARLNTKVPGTVSADDVAIINGELKAVNDRERRNGEGADWFSMLFGVAEVTKASADAD